ncbi:MAG: hypothetical protein ACD_75C01796G0001 [uncultured bacterium]|nr:MAG: hypothetical protein ACD_75C01796G0001 [uncultured bacterium]
MGRKEMGRKVESGGQSDGKEKNDQGKSNLLFRSRLTRGDPGNFAGGLS